MFVVLRRALLMMGLAGIVAFLATGLYMDRVHGHLRGYDDTLRMLYRSCHIYLLLSGTIDLMAGLYLRPAATTARRALQVVGSFLLWVAPALFLAGFCTEPHLAQLARPWSRLGIYLVFAGGLCHLVAACSWRPNTLPTEVSP